MQVLAKQKQSAKDQKNNSPASNQKTNDSEYRRIMTFAYAAPGIKKKNLNQGNAYRSTQQSFSLDFNKIPLFSPQTAIIQPKLKISQPNDKYEQEADAVAEKIANTPKVDIKPYKAAAVNPTLQNNATNSKEKNKEPEKEEQEEQEDPEDLQKRKIQKDFSDGRQNGNRKILLPLSGTNAPAPSATVLQTLQSPGQPLDKAILSFMELRFGFDFSNVQIHDNAEAHQSAKDINALAYTHGNHIAFDAGRYAPQTVQGKKLLAHELTHVVQQNAGIYRKINQSVVVDNAQKNEDSTPATQTGPDPDDEEIVSQFAAVNKGLSKQNLTKWIKISIANGWQPGQPVPNYKKPSISFNDKDELVVEAVSFRGKDGAFNTASQILPKNVGAKFLWKQRFTDSIGEYKLDYASNKAYENLKLHEAAKDVDFDALLKVSEDLSDYREVMAKKAYSDKLLSEALVRLIAMAQQKLYPQNIEKQTGILDKQTATDINSKIAADKVAAEKKKQMKKQPQKKRKLIRKYQKAQYTMY